MQYMSNIIHMYNYKYNTAIPKSELQKDVNYGLCVHISEYMSNKRNKNIRSWFLDKL